MKREAVAAGKPVMSASQSASQEATRRWAEQQKEVAAKNAKQAVAAKLAGTGVSQFLSGMNPYQENQAKIRGP